MLSDSKVISNDDDDDDDDNNNNNNNNNNTFVSNTHLFFHFVTVQQS